VHQALTDGLNRPHPAWHAPPEMTESAFRGWKVFEAPGVEPVFPEKRQAIDYAETRACFRSGEIRVLDSSGNVERTIAFNETGRMLDVPCFATLSCAVIGTFLIGLALLTSVHAGRNAAFLLLTSPCAPS
jgi:hypothetical protein